MLNWLLFKIYSLMQIDVNLVVDTNQEREMVFFSKSSFSWPELSWMNLQFYKLWRFVNQISAFFFITTARLRVAIWEKAEVEKTLQVKWAEGEGEAKYLLGVGVARQRQAIVDGLRESVLWSVSLHN